MNERIQKLIARAGVCSRRHAEELITAGRVCVNGGIASLGDTADAAADTITVDGSVLTFAAPPVYLMLYKPRGYVTTLSDEQGRRTAAQLVQDCGQRVFPVGRLDLNSEGLLLFTNDGALMQGLTHPKHQVDKVYEVTVDGGVDNAAAKLAAVDALDGEPIAPAQVEMLDARGGQLRLRVTIHQGKNRQIRRMCEQVGLYVRRLKRVQEHTLTLGDLHAGQWRYLTPDEVEELKGAAANDG